MMLFILLLPISFKNSIADEYTQNVTNILAGLEDLKKDVMSLAEQSNDIKVSLGKLALNISETIQMNALVALQKERLDIAKTNGEPMAECENIFHSKYHWVIDTLQEYVSNKLSHKLKIILDSLRYIEENTDGFITKIKSSDVSTQEIEKIIGESEMSFYVVERLKHILPILVKNALYNLDEEPIANVVKYNLLKPVFECLENSEISEYHGK